MCINATEVTRDAEEFTFKQGNYFRCKQKSVSNLKWDGHGQSQ